VLAGACSALTSLGGILSRSLTSVGTALSGFFTSLGIVRSDGRTSLGIVRSGGRTSLGIVHVPRDITANNRAGAAAIMKSSMPVVRATPAQGRRSESFVRVAASRIIDLYRFARIRFIVFYADRVHNRTDARAR